MMAKISWVASRMRACLSPSPLSEASSPACCTSTFRLQAIRARSHTARLNTIGESTTKKNREYRPILAMQSNDTAFSTSMFTAGSAFRRLLSLSHAAQVNFSVTCNKVPSV